MRDSAGIRIVENPESPPRPALTLSAAPVLTIGVVSGDTPYLLNGVVGATRLSDGRIVVANGGTRELRFFTADGTYVRNAAGQGQGPGEFRWLRRFARLPGDTLIGTDLTPTRWNWYDAAGEFLTMTDHALRGEPPTILQDASFVMQIYEGSTFGAEFELFAVGQRTADSDGVFRPPFALTHVGRGGTPIDTLGMFIGEELYKVEIAGSFGVTWYMPFARRTLFAATTDGRIWVMHTSRPELDVYDIDGTLRMRVRFTASPLTVVAEDRDAFRASVEPRINPNRRADFERWFAEVPYPDTHAFVTALAAGSDGTVWLKEATPASAATEAWTVFAADGERLGVVTLPAGSELLEIGEDYIIVLWRDELDVEFLRMYAIEGA